MAISLEQLNRATLATQGELADHGFWVAPFFGAALFRVLIKALNLKEQANS